MDIDHKCSGVLPGGSELRVNSVICGAAILTSDDDQQMRNIIRTALYMLGVKKVFEASDGFQTLSMLNNITIDVLIVDLLVGEAIGLDLIRIIRASYDQHHRTMPIIILSALRDERHVKAARDAGATEFLVKPISPGRLIERLVDVMNHARPLTISDSFIGPDRRRRLAIRYLGPERRPTTTLTTEERRFLTAARPAALPPAKSDVKSKWASARKCCQKLIIINERMTET